MTEPQDRFSRLVSGSDEAVDLALASLLVAAQEYPGLEVERYLDRLDAMGREARARIGRGPGTAVEALNAYLFE